MPKETGTQHKGSSTVWLKRPVLEYLKQIATVRGDETLDSVVTRILDHYRTCPHGLREDLRDAQKRLETLRRVQIVEMA
jgi:hypothetical protein